MMARLWCFFLGHVWRRDFNVRALGGEYMVAMLEIGEDMGGGYICWCGRCGIIRAMKMKP